MYTYIFQILKYINTDITVNEIYNTIPSHLGIQYNFKCCSRMAFRYSNYRIIMFINQMPSLWVYIY